MEQNQTDPTRERLLDEAEKLFADKGFDAVSVREITAMAESHLSAVNYHFGTKKNLYLAVFQERWIPRAKQVGDLVREFNIDDEKCVEKMVHNLAEGILRGFGDERVRHMHHNLMYREMTRPTEALGMIAEQVTKPFFISLKQKIQESMPGSRNGDEMFLCILSIFAQITFFNFGRSMVSLLAGREYDQAFQDQVVEHITNFSLYGLHGRPMES